MAYQEFIEKKINPAFVLGLYIPGIDAIKDLSKRGVECYGFSINEDAPGLYLRKNKTFLCPDPNSKQEKWLDFIIKKSENFELKPVLIVTSDNFIETIAENKKILNRYFLFHHFENDIILKLSSKRGLYNLALKYNLPVPKTIFYDSIENTEDIKKIQYPCIIKPEFAHEWRTQILRKVIGQNKVILIDNNDKLKKLIDKLSQVNNRFIIQEIIPGPDKNLKYFVSYMSGKKCLGYFCGQKLRITPIHFGSASYIKICDSSAIKKMCLDFLMKIQYWGPSGIELKRDESDGKYKLIEINPRFGLWDNIGNKVGINLYYIAYLDLIGREIEAISPKLLERYWVSLSRDITTFFEYKREGLLSTCQWIKSLFGKITYGDLYWDEPKIIYNIFIKRLLKKLFKK